jgi:PAS domain S-box-containing protein
MIKILAIDDYPDSLVSISELLIEFLDDCSVITASSGAEGIQKASEDLPDTILLDIIMPGMDGFEVCKRLRGNEETKHIPVIMLTGVKTDSKTKNKALDVGADAFLSKPIDPTELTAQIRAMVKIRRAAEREENEKERLGAMVDERTRELQASKDKLSSAAEMARLGHWEYDVANDLFTVYDQFYKIFHTTVEEAGGYAMSFAEYARRFVHPDDASDVREEIRKDVETTGTSCSRQLEHRVLRADGTTGHMSVRFFVVRDADGRAVWVYGVNQDTTELKRAEEALRQSEERFKLAMDASRDGIWDDDVNSDEVYYSPSFAAMLGFDSKEVPPHVDSWMRLIHSDQRGAVKRAYMVCIENRCQDFDREFRMRTKDGQWRWILGRGKVVSRDGSGRALRMVGTFTDITERKRAEEERRALEEQLWQVKKAESLGRMARAIAHNFNNQLYAVMGNLEIALEDLPADAPQRQFLTEALQAAKSSAETSRLMLTYLGQSTDKGEPINLSDVCRRNMPSLQGVIAEGIALETDFMDTGPIVRASPGQMQQIITHLTTNAVEAIGDMGGKIMLATRTMPADDIPESHLAPPDWKPAADSYACLEVTDSGGGIANEDMDKIFDPFFSTKFTGRGLGLAVIIGVARQGGGAVSVESKTGYGSTFRVLFPLVDDAVPLVPQKDTTVQPIPVGRSVLLVDDEDMVRNMVKQRLKHLGHSVHAAPGGTEALELFNRQRDEIGCVIIDLTMPGMDGWETIAALRRIDPDIPIILTSGYDEAAVMGGGQSERPQVFLQKPYALADLKAALSAVGMGAGKLE